MVRAETVVLCRRKCPDIGTISHRFPHALAGRTMGGGAPGSPHDRRDEALRMNFLLPADMFIDRR